MRIPRVAWGLLFCSLIAGSAWAARPAPIHGYIDAPGGVSLEYILSLPSETVPPDGWPVLLTYDGYAAGGVEDKKYADQFVPLGYALVGVSIRGTGCSSGKFDFFEPVQAEDGVDVIRWIALQPWSNGKIAMIGKSFPGISQLFVAAACADDVMCSAHLLTIAPGHHFGDAYRDVAYPGGIFNYGFAALWSFVSQPEPGEANALGRIAGGDTQCLENRLDHLANLPYNPFVQAIQHPYDDGLFRERSPIHQVGKIRVPVYFANAWQDEQLGPRSTYLFERLERAPLYHALLGNGSHGLYRYPRHLARLQAWFDYHMKGIGPEPAKQKPVTVWFEQTSTTSAADGWSIDLDRWPLDDDDVTPLELRLRSGGRLTTEPARADEAPDVYLYPGGTQSRAGEDVNDIGKIPRTLLDFRSVAFALPPLPGFSATYVTEPLADDVVVLGTGRAKLWIASTAVDTDFQVSIGDVWPNGDVEYVQKGWLRASHRKLVPPDDAEASPSRYRPVHSHRAADARLLTPGVPTRIDVEIPPVGQVFRRGHRIRVDVEMPNVLPELWASVPLPIPAIELVYHDPRYPSSILLPTLAAVRVPPAPAAAKCGDRIRQPCRRSIPLP